MFNTNITDKQKFEHDCESCIFLGHMQGSDLYAHPNRTVVARYSNDGPDYISGTEIAHMDTRLAVAFVLADKYGIPLDWDY